MEIKDWSALIFQAGGKDWWISFLMRKKEKIWNLVSSSGRFLRRAKNRGRFAFSGMQRRCRVRRIMELINKRKQDHLEIALTGNGIDRQRGYFDQIQLRHRALPEIDLKAVDTRVEFMGKELSFPLLLSSMTGGAGEELARINQNLAQGAEAAGVALAVGSQRVLLSDESARSSFELRRYAPSILLLSNLGAVQLNDGVDAQGCERLVREMGADGICLHLNPLQEAIQPEGDTNFFGLTQKIAAVVRELKVPVLVKEVGSGILPEDLKRLLDAGVRYVDVAGSGGTSWSQIESQRSRDPKLGALFADWGIPTPQALRLAKPFLNRLELVASGGIRNGLDMVKSLVLGASVCGMALPFLKPAQESPEAVRDAINRVRKEFSIAMFLLGAQRVDEIKNNEELLLNESGD